MNELLSADFRIGKRFVTRKECDEEIALRKSRDEQTEREAIGTYARANLREVATRFVTAGKSLRETASALKISIRTVKKIANFHGLNTSGPTYEQGIALLLQMPHMCSIFERCSVEDDRPIHFKLPSHEMPPDELLMRKEDEMEEDAVWDRKAEFYRQRCKESVEAMTYQPFK